MTGSGHDDYTVDISGGKDARAETIQGDPNWKVYSPNRTYVIECKDNFRMMRVKDNSLVSETPVSPPDPSSISCSTFIQWAPDESFAGFLANDLSIFIWESNGAEPAKVFGPLSTRYTNIAWSPDSKKMAFVRSTTRLPDGPPLGTAVILDRDGQFLSEVQVQIVDSAILWWLTNDVLESISRSQTWFYDITSGDLLFSWKDQPTASGNFHQRLRVSPDGRWVFIDQGDQIHDSTTQSNRVIVEKQYALYDIQNKTSIPLLDDPETYLLFAGWNADNSKMYVISRPAESTSKSSPAAPFGLLAFDPKARQFELLFKDAVQISWNSDMSQAFIVFAAQTTEGRLGLAGGLWMPGTQTVTGQINVSNQMVYQDPAQETYFSLYPGPFPIVWSHDDQRMAICDNFGNVKLIHKNGTEQILSTAISGKVWLRWSPDDQHLLVLSDNRAWIVNVLTG